MFRAPAMLLPHESTVAHEQRFIMEAPMISRTRSRTAFGQSPHAIAETISLNEQQVLREQLKLEDFSKLEVCLVIIFRFRHKFVNSINRCFFFIVGGQRSWSTSHPPRDTPIGNAHPR